MVRTRELFLLLLGAAIFFSTALTVYWYHVSTQEDAGDMSRSIHRGEAVRNQSPPSELSPAPAVITESAVEKEEVVTPAVKKLNGPPEPLAMPFDNYVPPSVVASEEFLQREKWRKLEDIPDRATLSADPKQWFRDEVFWSEEFPALRLVLERYATRHQEWVDRKDVHNLKALVIAPAGGLGNRYLPLMSGLVAALLSDRLLLIRWKNVNDQPGGLSTLFEMPFDLLIESHPSWDRLIHNAGPHMKIYEAVNWDDPRNAMACGNLTEAWPEQVILLGMEQFIMPYLLFNPNYRDILASWGLTANSTADFYRPLQRFLLPPSAVLRTKIQAFTAHYFEGAYVIGVQVRMKNYWMRKGDDLQIHQSMACVDATINATLHVNRTAAQPLRIFLATDQQNVKEAYQQYYAPRNITLLSLADMLSPGKEIDDFSGEGRQANGIMDNELLSQTDFLFTSSLSSYGYLARGRRSHSQVGIMVDMLPHEHQLQEHCRSIPWNWPCMHAHVEERYKIENAVCYEKVRQEMGYPFEDFEAAFQRGLYC